jgi:ABC-type transport system substrate-binding protein
VLLIRSSAENGGSVSHGAQPRLVGSGGAAAQHRPRGAENAPGYSNPKVDELIETIGATTVTYARDALIEEVWKIVLGDIVYIPLHYQTIVWAMRENLEIAVYPFNRPIFAEARFK